MRQVFHSGYCYVVPEKEERELIKETIDDEYLKLGQDRIPALEDIRYYDKFDRHGNIIEEHHFVVEEITDIDVTEIHKHSGFEDDKWQEKVEAIVKVRYKVSLFKEKNPAVWEPSPQITDI